jgi:hypothetical protein
MKVTIEIDSNDEGHKIDGHLRGPELKMILADIEKDISNFLQEGHQFITADAAFLYLLDKLKKDADYFNIKL